MTNLVFEDVTRRFGDVVALNRVGLEIGPGITALVGPNGAGKSTFMKVATGHVRPTMGNVSAFGQTVWDNPAVMARVGFVPEQDAFYDQMSGLRFVATLAELNGMNAVQARRKAAEELDRLGLHEGLERPIRTYSKGMRQRVKLAQALVHEPELLFLDEPLLGCDPVARRRIQDRILGMKKDGGTIILSSHILPEVERLTRNIAILSGGRLVAQGNAGQVRDALSQVPSRIRVHTEASRAVAATVSRWPEVTSIQIASNRIDIETPQMKAFLERLHTEARADWRIGGLETLDADLDSLFAYLAGESE